MCGDKSICSKYGTDWFLRYTRMALECCAPGELIVVYDRRNVYYEFLRPLEWIWNKYAERLRCWPHERLVEYSKTAWNRYNHYLYSSTQLYIFHQKSNWFSSSIFNQFWFVFFLFIFRAAKYVRRHSRMCIACNATWLVTMSQRDCANSNATIVIKHSNSSIIWRNTFVYIRARSHSVAQIAANVFRIPAHILVTWLPRSASVPASNWIVQRKWIKRCTIRTNGTHFYHNRFNRNRMLEISVWLVRVETMTPAWRPIQMAMHLWRWCQSVTDWIQWPFSHCEISRILSSQQCSIHATYNIIRTV